ncbi:uncharacterized protein LOC128964397 [Oppia nitens]|uniref:uncharacterized protein LOC128964397 n=1 Tax=Oppia nitens TaxID=1686743 RepID=UPI0023DB6EB6|nr:uncharacterized protein LOC128964397 [Oppia nitens]
MTSSSSDTTNSSLTGTSPLISKLSITPVITTDPSTIKKGLLWQQRDRFFSRWKERYFVLTKDYFSCFKKGSKVGMSEMGSFMYKLTLVDVEGLNWADKKRDGVIAIRVGTEGQLLLWTNSGLDEWMFALREAVNRSKGRREALRKSQTLLPSMTGGNIWNRQKITSLHYQLTDSAIGASNTTSRLQRATSADFTNCDDANRQLRSTIHHNPTPVLNRRLQRISVLTNIDLSLERDASNRKSVAVTDDQQHQQMIPNRAGLPRLAPQCGGNVTTNGNQVANSSQHSSLQSLVSLGRTTGHLISNQLNRPSPRSLQVSPALTQRSLYAQHILSSPEIIGINTTDSRHHQMAKSALKTATSEFSFIRPDSPLTLPHNSHISTAGNNPKRPQYQRSQSCLEPQQKADSQKFANHISNGVNRSQSASTKQTMEKMIQQSTRPSSIYGQPSLTDRTSFSGNRVNHNSNYRIEEYVSSGDPSIGLTANNGHNGYANMMNGRVGVRDTKSMPKRHINRHYKPSKSDTVFATTNRLHSISSSGEKSPINESNVSTNDKLINRKRIQSKELFAIR